jgi:hypothetical protein
MTVADEMKGVTLPCRPDEIGPVGRDVGDWRNDGPHIVDPLGRSLEPRVADTENLRPDQSLATRTRFEVTRLDGWSGPRLLQAIRLLDRPFERLQEFRCQRPIDDAVVDCEGATHHRRYRERAVSRHRALLAGANR